MPVYTYQKKIDCYNQSQLQSKYITIMNCMIVVRAVAIFGAECRRMTRRHEQHLHVEELNMLIGHFD